MRLARVVAGVALAVATLAPAAHAQGYFGQNQVQYDKFHWRVLETEHFLVHYYTEETEAAHDAARMAERSYARLSRVLDHQFREKKPIILYTSRADFGQNNITGDLGEGTGGVTEPLRQRNVLPFTGDYRSFEHVLTHEMVHQFQYDIFSRGKAGNNLQALQQFDPPLWFAEGMAEYLSIGPDHPFTASWIRDAALNGTLPSIEQMTREPDRFFPYRFGEALWAYVGQRWGDEIVGQIMNAVPSIGVERAVKRETGLSLDDLSDEWREAMQTQHLPQVAQLDRPRKFAQALLSRKKSGGDVFVAPALSSDGKYIAFLSNGSFLRGQVFIDLWLGDAKTGKRIKRLVKSNQPNTEELQIIYSQSAFSPDAKTLAYTAQKGGRDVLYLMDVKHRKTIHSFDLPLETVTGPSFSPDGRTIVLSGGNGGLTDLYTVNTDGSNFRQLTKDRYGDLMPQWSPDGHTIAFVSDRGDGTSFATLRFEKFRISTVDINTGEVRTLPGQGGLNLNPQWAPDGRSIAYVSDRTGVSNVFLYDLNANEHYQLTNVVGAVNAFTEYSPAISWAHQADRLAFTYYENGDYTVWAVDNPRLLKKQPYREQQNAMPTLIASRAATDSANAHGGSPRQTTTAVTPSGLPTGGPPAAGTTAPNTGAPGGVSGSPTATPNGPPAPALTPGGAKTPPGATAIASGQSFYRGSSGVRESAALPVGTRDTTSVSVAALLADASMALPDTTRFRDVPYKVHFSPEYVSRPTVGYAQDSYGRGLYGGTTIVLADMLGDHQLAFSGAVNGRLSDAQVYAGFTNLGSRLQYNVAGLQQPYYLLGSYDLANVGTGYVESTGLVRYLQREFSATSLYPLNRQSRFEAGLALDNIDRSSLFVSRFIYPDGTPTQYQNDSTINYSSLNYVAPYVAFVSDNALFGYTGPIMGRRMRFSVQPTIGSFRWTQFVGDYRRYDPILFNFLTVATRVVGDVKVGRDENAFQTYLANPNNNYYVRGYDRTNLYNSCGAFGSTAYGCNATQLLGSRAAFANAELRFPLIRRLDLGVLPISLPPLEGLVFYDAGVAWSAGQSVRLRAPQGGVASDPLVRSVLRSYGAGLRLNLFGFAIVRWDYAIPLDTPERKGFWTWSLGPSF